MYAYTHAISVRLKTSVNTNITGLKHSCTHIDNRQVSQEVYMCRCMHVLMCVACISGGGVKHLYIEVLHIWSKTPKSQGSYSNKTKLHSSVQFRDSEGYAE